MRILVIGVSGMIGSTVFRVLDEKNDWKVFGSIRDVQFKRFFSPASGGRLIPDIDVQSNESLVRLLDQVQPAVVVNCAGLTKHKPAADDPLLALPLNALMPHRLAGLCKLVGARLIHVSTDCVFSGEKGGYLETDFADAKDIYGKSKALGEVVYPHTVTLRTSTIGHELQSKYGLLDWFLAQEGQCKGYRRAIFSGLPTVVFAQIIRDVVIPRPELAGLFHVAAEPIAKFDLLQLIARVYGKTINIIPEENFTIDRSLDASYFRQATGYVAPSWPDLIATMHSRR